MSAQLGQLQVGASAITSISNSMLMEYLSQDIQYTMERMQNQYQAEAYTSQGVGQCAYYDGKYTADATRDSAIGQIVGGGTAVGLSGAGTALASRDNEGIKNAEQQRDAAQAYKEATEKNNGSVLQTNGQEPPNAANTNYENSKEQLRELQNRDLTNRNKLLKQPKKAKTKWQKLKRKLGSEEHEYVLNDTDKGLIDNMKASNKPEEKTELERFSKRARKDYNRAVQDINARLGSKNATIQSFQNIVQSLSGVAQGGGQTAAATAQTTAATFRKNTEVNRSADSFMKSTQAQAQTSAKTFLDTYSQVTQVMAGISSAQLRG